MFALHGPLWRRRCAVMVCGIVIMGIGVCLFRLSLMGNDPSSAMVMAIGSRIGQPFSVTLIAANSIWFLLELFCGRRFIGIGTFFNWFGVGVFPDLWTAAITRLFVLPTSLAGRLGLMLLGVLILSFSCALYQTADLGIAPYDAISIIMADRLPLPYFWCRILSDSVCAVTAFALGGSRRRLFFRRRGGTIAASSASACMSVWPSTAKARSSSPPATSSAVSSAMSEGRICTSTFSPSSAPRASAV